MAISIKNLRRVKADQPPRILIYGPAGIGKTTLASEFPEPVFLQIEDGTPGDVDMVSFGHLTSYREVMQALWSLAHDEHPFRTVVLDSITAFQRLVFAEACERGDERGNKKNNIEDFGFGKGYVYATRIWQAGGEAELHVWPGAYQCFEILAPEAELSVAATERRTAWLGRALLRS